MRQTIKEVDTNVAYRWFLGYSFEEKIPHFSTFGKNYVRRFRETTVFEDIFAYILEQAVKAGFVTRYQCLLPLVFSLFLRGENPPFLNFCKQL